MFFSQFDLYTAIAKGEVFEFFGVNENCFKIGNYVLEAIEDPSDGYRSMLEGLMGIGQKECAKRNLHFFSRSIASVKIVKVVDENFNGFRLVDGCGHVWLSVGTIHHDEYYPCFTFEYTPAMR